MNFLMDEGSTKEKEMYAKVLDPATRAEMRNTGFVMGDSISAVSSGVFERAYMQNSRWTENKLGSSLSLCLAHPLHPHTTHIYIPYRMCRGLPQFNVTRVESRTLRLWCCNIDM